MKHNQKPFDQWTKWDWFMDDVKYILMDPCYWMIGILVLLAVALVVFVVVAIIAGPTTESTHSSFWTWYNLQTVLRNLTFH